MTNLSIAGKCQLKKAKSVMSTISLKTLGCECALWSNLYPDLSYRVKPSLNGKQNRASTKIAFMTKVLSQIADYGTNFELRQFHYGI